MHVGSVERRLTVRVLDDVGGRQSWADLRERERGDMHTYIYIYMPHCRRRCWAGVWRG
jgi:hypothetical protein